MIIHMIIYAIIYYIYTYYKLYIYTIGFIHRLLTWHIAFQIFGLRGKLADGFGFIVRMVDVNQRHLDIKQTCIYRYRML